ncbi:MAG: hypothetical protein ACTSYB_02085 [Candidatus Helarchaeota archaeon]
MGRKSNEDEICEAILNELYDISEKRGITFNKLFNKIKQKRGKFSYDTLSKYLNKMEQDGRIIRVIDVNSNKKIKPTLLYKNSEIVHLRNQKINFKNIFMDKHTKIHKLAKERLKNSDLFPKFNELILKFLDEKMNINVDHLNPEAVMNWNIILENFEFFSIENPEIKEPLNNLEDITLLIYLNLLEIMINTNLINNPVIYYNLSFRIDLHKLLSSVILYFAQKIQKEKLSVPDLFSKGNKVTKKTYYTEEDILKSLINQLPYNIRKEIKKIIQQKKLREFSEKYKRSLKIYP